MPVKDLITITMITERLNITRRRVLWAVEKLAGKGLIKPRFVGNTRTFTFDEAELIYSEIAATNPSLMLMTPERAGGEDVIG